jgi:hypothetical protein
MFHAGGFAKVAPAILNGLYPPRQGVRTAVRVDDSQHVGHFAGLVATVRDIRNKSSLAIVSPSMRTGGSAILGQSGL